jgi:hypothetical protein
MYPLAAEWVPSEHDVVDRSRERLWAASCGKHRRSAP